MPKKDSLSYVCSNCGVKSSSWSGRCHACGEWNSFQEQLSQQGLAAAGRRGQVLASHDIKTSLQSDHARLVAGMSQLDAVLGGGLVAGSVNLLAGQPGIGKSTLLLQLANALAARYRVLYVSGEESAHQISLRATRLGVTAEKLQLATSGSAEDIASTIAAKEYQIVIVDSVQTLSCQAIAAAAGSVSQITNSSQLLTTAAKQSDTTVMLVGHVTKEGSIAGPKVLEHLVDVVLQLEGDRYGGFKVLRPIKNRYGSTSETAIYEMTTGGLKPVANPSAALLAERQASDGSVVLATIEGSRPLLVEVQALVNRTAYGYPKRAASGLDLNRVNLLIAVLERRTKLNLSDKDIYVNIIGGLKINEPAADLAVCMAIASAAKGLPLKANLVVFGEVGLAGEIRHVAHADKRLREAGKLGFDGALGPAARGPRSATYHTAGDIRSALNQFLAKGAG